MPPEALKSGSSEAKVARWIGRKPRGASGDVIRGRQHAAAVHRPGTARRALGPVAAAASAGAAAGAACGPSEVSLAKPCKALQSLEKPLQSHFTATSAGTAGSNEASG